MNDPLDTGDLVRRLRDVDVSAPVEILSGLSDRYGEPHRAYHDASHIRAMLGLMDGDGLRDRAAALLAILYHDAIYDPRRADNEAESAELLRRDFEDRTTAATLERACAIIRATKTHELADVDDRDMAAVLDADLAILGSETDAFDAYDAAIRREFAHVPTLLYRIGRRKVLKRFLASERIYRTEAFERLEAPARRNLARAIGGLRLIR